MMRTYFGILGWRPPLFLGKFYPLCMKFCACREWKNKTFSQLELILHNDFTEQYRIVSNIYGISRKCRSGLTHKTTLCTERSFQSKSELCVHENIRSPCSQPAMLKSTKRLNTLQRYSAENEGLRIESRREFSWNIWGIAQNISPRLTHDIEKADIPDGHGQIIQNRTQKIKLALEKWRP